MNMARVLLLIDSSNPFPADLEKVLRAGGYEVYTYDITNRIEFDSEPLCDADICVVSLPARPIALLATGWLLGKEKKVVAYASKTINVNEASNAFDGIAHSLHELVGLVKTTLMKSMIPIDLGLSVLWADRNLGAQSVDDFGLYVGWCRINGRRVLKDNTGRRVYLPKGWRLPTADEIVELLQQCKIEQGYNNEAKVVGTTGDSVIFKYGSYYSAEWNITPEANNTSGFFLSSTLNQWNGNTNFLFFGLSYGRYQHYIVKNGEPYSFFNARLVKDRTTK